MICKKKGNTLFVFMSKYYVEYEIKIGEDFRKSTIFYNPLLQSDKSFFNDWETIDNKEALAFIDEWTIQSNLLKNQVYNRLKNELMK